MKVFLTGATGFVGSALLSRFVADGVSVRALVRRRLDGLPDAVEQVVGDLLGFVDVESSPSPQPSPIEGEGAFKGVDVVVHVAARAHIMRDEVADPLAEYRKVNRGATLALARLAAQAGVGRFVFVSSVKVNGEMTFSHSLSPSPQPSPIEGEGVTKFRPDDKFVPTDPYGLSKYEAEQGLLAIARETGVEVVIIRPPLVYGPNVKGNFASMVNWVKKGVPLPLGAVCNLRSLVALDNLVDFIALCADRERSPKAANEVFLISDGVDVSTSDLLRKVAKACGVKSRLLPVPVGLMRFAAKALSKGAVADRLFGNLQVDSSKAQDLLGWQPVVTMDEALERMFSGEG
ncbi:NAD-dependent epimerase/dehydratase family protein [Thiomicrospira microaerophila]|uniref:NAD-dependent epimerase/dehydratase family protein n=1 Tax=Thiomicrospira microaerophila TaxID=406020 RepID=UPI0005C87434|nr:NAD-dependent epimerase/dehydratase family protein [Thiomicrospira microaerophila]